MEAIIEILKSENTIVMLPLINELKEQTMKYKGITIHKRQNCNTWYTRFRKNNKVICISAKTQKECYEKLKIEYNKKEVVDIKKSITLQEWYLKWLELYKIGKVKDTTINSYKVAWKHIPDELLSTHIDKIKVEHIITTLANCKAERLSQNLYDLLAMLFKKAFDNELISKNIMILVDKPKHEKQHSEALTNTEQIAVENTCKELNIDFILISMYQGLRRGEILGLTRDNIDFEKNTLSINKAWNYKNQFDTTKNKQSIRTMPLFNESKAILLKYKNIPNDNRIFNISMKQHDNIIKKLKSKLPFDIKTKDMRTTFITRCTELGIPEFVIQSWVGHKIGSKVTKDSYTTHNTEIDNKYINILNQSKLYTNCTHKK